MITGTNSTVHILEGRGVEVVVMGSKEFSVVVLVLIGVMLDESVEVVEASVVGSTDLGSDSVAGEQTVTAFNWLSRLPTKIFLVEIAGMIFVRQTFGPFIYKFQNKINWRVSLINVYQYQPLL